MLPRRYDALTSRQVAMLPRRYDVGMGIGHRKLVTGTRFGLKRRI